MTSLNNLVFSYILLTLAVVEKESKLIAYHSMEWKAEFQQWKAKANDGQNGDNQSSPTATQFILKGLQKGHLWNQSCRAEKYKETFGWLVSFKFLHMYYRIVSRIPGEISKIYNIHWLNCFSYKFNKLLVSEVKII